MCRIVTGSAPMESVQAASHGAGQMRPVTSGKLFVSCRNSRARCQSPRNTISLNSGMRFDSGHP